jgi:hypothetical protein
MMMILWHKHLDASISNLRIQGGCQRTASERRGKRFPTALDPQSFSRKAQPMPTSRHTFMNASSAHVAGAYRV